MDIHFPKINNKLAFFDFDRTLVAHTYGTEHIKASYHYFTECLFMLTKMEQEYENDKPLPCMQWYTKKLFDDGYGLYVLTHGIFNLRDELKQAELKKFYPDTPMTYLTTDTPEHKIDMIRAVAMAEECELSDVIFVDDRMDTINLARLAGINAKHLSDIVVMYESKLSYSQQDSVLKLEKPEGTEETQVPEEELFDTDGLDENLEKVYQECRELAEMNGRGQKNKEHMGV